MTATPGHAPAVSAPPTRTVSEAVADSVAAEAALAFGVMGNGNAHLIGSLTARGYRFVQTRHEAGAVAAAQAHWVAAGRLAAATTTFGPGFTNTLTMLADARMARTPLVLIAGAAPAEARPVDVDQAALAGTLGVPVVTVEAATAGADARRAFALARRELVPVVLLLLFDLTESPAAEPAEAPSGAGAAYALAAGEPAPPAGDAGGALDAGGAFAAAAGEPPAPNPVDVTRIAALLAGAERPLVLHGRGALGAGEAIRGLADRLGALIGTSLHTRGLTGSPWEVGVVGGFSSPGARDLIQSADVVLVLGASLNTFQTRYGQYFAGARHVIQVDLAEGPTSSLVTDYLRADAALAARALVVAVPEREGETWREAAPAVADRSLHRPDGLAEFAGDGRLDPRALSLALDEILPRERAFVQDGGHFFAWLNMYAAAPEPGAMQHPGTGFHTIGTGFPAALGAALARPDLLTVAVTGDGGAMMCLPDLETLIREVPRALVVCFNDSAYGMEVHQYVPKGVDGAAMVFPDVDIAGIAGAMGGRGVRVRALADLAALREWLDAGDDGVLVLDCAVSRTVVAEFVSEKLVLEAGE